MEMHSVPTWTTSQICCFCGDTVGLFASWLACVWWWCTRAHLIHKLVFLLFWGNCAIVFFGFLWTFVLFCHLGRSGSIAIDYGPVWPPVYNLCLKFCCVGHPGHWGTVFGVQLIFKYTCSNWNLKSSPWPLRHSVTDLWTTEWITTMMMLSDKWSGWKWWCSEGWVRKQLHYTIRR